MPKAAPSLAGRHLIAFGQDLYGKGGRRHAQPKADNDGLANRREERGGQDQQRSGAAHLGHAQSDNLAPHYPQSGRTKFQTDDEQQDHNAEFGYMQDFFAVMKDAQHIRSQDDTGREIAQNRSKPQPSRNRNRDDRGSQKDRVFIEEAHLYRTLERGVSNIPIRGPVCK